MADRPFMQLLGDSVRRNADRFYGITPDKRAELDAQKQKQENWDKSVKAGLNDPSMQYRSEQGRQIGVSNEKENIEVMRSVLHRLDFSQKELSKALSILGKKNPAEYYRLLDAAKSLATKYTGNKMFVHTGPAKDPYELAFWIEKSVYGDGAARAGMYDMYNDYSNTLQNGGYTDKVEIASPNKDVPTLLNYMRELDAKVRQTKQALRTRSLSNEDRVTFERQLESYQYTWNDILAKVNAWNKSDSVTDLQKVWEFKNGWLIKPVGRCTQAMYAQIQKDVEYLNGRMSELGAVSSEAADTLRDYKEDMDSGYIGTGEVFDGKKKEKVQK